MEIDYRPAALASLLPDLVDKPLALTLLSNSGTSQGPSHSLAIQACLTFAVAMLRRTWIPYALISNSHLFADQMWKYRRTLLFPFSRHLDSWRFMGSPIAMLSAYAEIIARPAILAVEVGGMLILGLFLRQGKLGAGRAIVQLLATGRPGTPSGSRHAIE